MKWRGSASLKVGKQDLTRPSSGSSPKKAPLTVYDIWRKLRSQRDFTYTRYHIVNRRIRLLKNQGFIEKVGERETKTGFQAALYRLTVRFYLAIILDKFNIDAFLMMAPSEDVLTLLAVLASQQYKKTE